MPLIDALEATLEHNLQIQAQAQGLRSTAARVLREQDRFDTVVDTSVTQSITFYPLTDYQHALALAAGINTFEQKTDYSSFDLRAQRQFEQGLRLSSTLDVSRFADNLENLGGVNTTRFNAALNIPLIAGRGRNANTAGVRSARLDVEAAQSAFTSVAASITEQAAEHYDQLAAAVESLMLTRAAEADAAQTLTDVQQLIRADKLAAAAVHQAEAALDSSKVRTLAVSQDVLAAQLKLAADMGTPVLSSRSLTADPDILLHLSTDIPTDADLPALIADALHNRAETDAAQRALQSAEVRRSSAANAVRHHLDLNVSTGYTGEALGLGGDDYLRSFGSRIGGANAQGSLTYHLDSGNRSARADLETASATVEQSRLNQQDLERTIASSVVLALDDLRSSREALDRSESAVSSLKLSVEGERARLRAGEGVLNDVLVADKQLLNAELDAVTVRLHLAIAIARMRLATGTVLSGTGTHISVDPQLFFTYTWTPHSGDRKP